MKARLQDSDYCRAAAQLGCEPAMVAAVAEQESLGAGFDSQDRPTVLFERHIFHRLTGGKYDESNPNISDSEPGGYGQTSMQYSRFSRAFELNSVAAMKATSWGKFQILGQNYAICGYANVGDFVTAMRESEAKQLDAFVAFCAGHGLDQYLTANDPAGFANGYNGHGYRKNHYDTKIEAGYRKWKRHDFGCVQESTTPSAETAATPPNQGGEPEKEDSAAEVPAVVPAVSADPSNVAATDSAIDPAEGQAQPPTSGAGSVFGNAAAKFDSATGTISDVTTRADSAKSLWSTVSHIVLQPFWAVFAFVAKMPWYMWLGVAGFIALSYVLYHYRQFVLGKIRELNWPTGGIKPPPPTNVEAKTEVVVK